MAWKDQLPQMNFFLEKQLIKFYVPISPFHSAKFKKNFLRADSELWGCTIFGPKMVQLSWTKSFLVQTIIFTFIYLLALFIVQNFLKNSYSGSRVMRMGHFWAQNGLFALNKIFLGKIKIIFIYLLATFIEQN